MIDPQSQALLQDVLRRESRSVLTYVAEAYPWADAAHGDALAEVQRLIADEREAVAGLGRFLARRRVPPPYLPSYPAHFTTINFLALDFLLPRLRDHEAGSIAELERDLAGLKDPDVRAELVKLLEVKRRHLRRLEELNSPAVSGPATGARAEVAPSPAGAT